MSESIDNGYLELVRELGARRSEHCFPGRVRSNVRHFTESLLALLFPHFADEVLHEESAVANELARLDLDLRQLMLSLGSAYSIPRQETSREFLHRLPDIYHALLLDARAILHGDPAAVSVDEVILAYPGFYAIAIHRLAHCLHQLGYPLLPRLMAEYAHHRTGIDIHPGATIGRSFFIDHGTGVVIGETAVIGNGVKIYQGVTLGAVSVQKALANRKRHPTLEDHVVVYANATILGGDTVIGHDSVIGGNAWVTESVPPFSIVGRHSDVRPRRLGEEYEIEFNI